MLDMRAILTGPVQQMAAVTRYSHRPVIRRENVAEHTWFVLFYAYAIGTDLRQRGYQVDLEKVFRRAIVHDLDEAVTGDFVRDFKYVVPGLAAKIKEATIHIFVKLLDQMGIGSRDAVYRDWEEAKARDLEGAIITLCDFLSVVAYVHREVSMGNRLVLPIVAEVRKYVREVFHDASPDHQRALDPYVQTTLEVLAELAPEPVVLQREPAHATMA